MPGPLELIAVKGLQELLFYVAIHFSYRRIIGASLSECNSTTLLKLYVAYVRPILEYVSYVWSPHAVKHIDMLERVQHFALAKDISEEVVRSLL